MAEKNQLSFGRIPSYRKYELFMERYRSAVDDFIVPHLKSLPPPPPPTGSSTMLLDVGAGEGYLKFFFDKSEPITFHGIEIQEDRIKVCEEMGYKIWTFDVEKDKFPFADNTYDVVVASHVLEHLYNPEPALQEIYRVLKPGGLVVIGVPMHVHWISKILQFKERLFPAERLEHHQFYSMKSLAKFLSGHEIVDIRGFRLISARRKFRWEDNIKFYNFNTWWGQKFPHLTPEVNVVIRKISGTAPTMLAGAPASAPRHSRSDDSHLSVEN